MRKISFSIIFLLIVFSIGVSAQTRDRKAAITANNTSKNCRVFLNGKLLNSPQPVYPIEAQATGAAGKVQVIVEIDKSGNVTEIENILGNELLRKSASEAALQAKFSPTLCDGKATKTIGVITFNYSQIVLTKEYFKPSKIEEFPDIKADSNFYEAILFLTENYQIAFGYADQKFHPEMSLTKGDFAHFLCQTLAMLERKGELAQKRPQEIGLYQSYNPQQLKDFEFNPTAPFGESVRILSQNYNIILADQAGIFDGDLLLTTKETIEIWRGIFSDEAVPVNFLNAQEQVKEMSRGDFAIYLKESLDVLTYKILP
jgi:TonB family protein